MNLVWIIAASLGAMGYLILLLPGILGLFRLLKTTSPQTFSTPFVSVIVAARNEEEVIESTLDSLLSQDYPKDRFEIIVVDDRSEDRTEEIIKRLSEFTPAIRLIKQTKINPQLSPKKQALEKAINSAKGDIIVSTDADCQHSPYWIRTLINMMTDETGMVIGQARFETGKDSPVWQRFQALDFQAISVLSAGLVKAGFPFTCSGASLAFRKALFIEVEGWKGVDRLISGDDELLLAKASRTDWKIAVATGADVVVSTRSPTDIKELWHQRVRWGSKGLLYRPSRKLILSGVFIFYLCLAMLPIMTALKLIGACAYGFWIGKMVLDVIVLLIGNHLFRENFNLLHFIIMEALHPFMITTFAVAGSFSSFEWKGQRFRSQEAVDK